MVGAPALRRWTNLAACSRDGECLFLDADQFADAAAGERNESIHFRSRKGRALCGTLNLDEAACAGHDHVHVGIASGIFAVIEIEYRYPVDDADRYRGDKIPKCRHLRGKQTLRLAPCHRVMERHAGAGDRRATRSTVCLEHVAVDADRALAPVREIRHRAQASADEALDLLRASALLAFRGFAAHARVGRTRQHSIFGGEPAATLALEESRHAFIDRGRAQNMCFAALDQRRAFCVPGVVARDRHRAQLVGMAAARAVGHRSLSCTVAKNRIIAAASDLTPAYSACRSFHQAAVAARPSSIVHGCDQWARSQNRCESTSSESSRRSTTERLAVSAAPERSTDAGRWNKRAGTSSALPSRSANSDVETLSRSAIGKVWPDSADTVNAATIALTALSTLSKLRRLAMPASGSFRPAAIASINDRKLPLTPAP